MVSYSAKSPKNLQIETEKELQKIAEVIVLTLEDFSRKEVSEKTGLSLYKVWKYRKIYLKREEADFE